MKKIHSNSLEPSQQQLNTLLEHYKAKRYVDVEKLSMSITQEFPEHPFAWKALAVVLKLTGRLNESLVANQKSAQLNPEDAEIHNNLSITFQELSRFDESEASCRQAITLKPDYAEAHYNLGNTLKELGRLDEAESSYRQAIRLKPDYAEAHYNLGNTLKELGRLDEAESSYRQAITLKPDFVKAHNNLGITLLELDRFDESEVSYRQAIKIKPNFAEAHSNLGNTLKELGRLDEAEASYRQAITLKPDYPDAYLNLCELLEKTNKVNEALLVIKNAKIKVVEKKADFLFYEALILFREKGYKKVEELIKKISKDKLSEKKKSSFMKLKADWHHYKRDYSAAYEEFKSMNEHVKDSYEYKKQKAENYFNHQRETLFQIKKLQQKKLYKSAIKPKWIQPTFLIGFPRSGTTLLDTILRTHSDIDVAEELPMLKKMNESLGYISTISMIENIDNKTAEIASNFYLEELKKYIEVGKKKIVIDKLPLNILQLPLINQIFPNAKFIMALRHPLDCVLSCWMQNFKLNPAMANMVDLDRIVDFYCTTMEILKLSQERYSLDIHRIHYEKLVLDFEGNVFKLLTFLNLKWENGLINYQKTALARDRIYTPSYSQVVKPIYSQASFRWKYYEEHLEPYKSQLAPWIQEYGYS